MVAYGGFLFVLAYVWLTAMLCFGWVAVFVWLVLILGLFRFDFEFVCFVVCVVLVVALVGVT